jgi:hypothetical protein
MRLVGRLTLSCTFDPVSNSDSLAVLELLAIPLANTLVGEILEMRHIVFVLLSSMDRLQCRETPLYKNIKASPKIGR